MSGNAIEELYLEEENLVFVKSQNGPGFINIYYKDASNSGDNRFVSIIISNITVSEAQPMSIFANTWVDITFQLAK